MENRDEAVMTQGMEQKRFSWNVRQDLSGQRAFG
jgi:hypothetical protein